LRLITPSTGSLWRDGVELHGVAPEPAVAVPANHLLVGLGQLGAALGYSGDDKLAEAMARM
jgi:hypothetical protein